MTQIEADPGYIDWDGWRGGEQRLWKYFTFKFRNLGLFRDQIYPYNKEFPPHSSSDQPSSLRLSSETKLTLIAVCQHSLS